MDISAHWDGCELDLVCSLDGLRKFIDVLHRNELGTYGLKVEESDSESKDILRLRIEPRNGKLMLSIENQDAVISGNLPSLRLLADNLEFLCGQWFDNGDQHLHLEPASNSFLFAPESEALIISQRSSPSN